MRSLLIAPSTCVALLAAPCSPAADSVATGDLQLRYVFKATGDTMPYRLYVPKGYSAARAWPLIVVLHGGGSDQNSAFNDTGLQQIAEQRGYLVLAPLGYSRFGGFGNIYPVVVTPATAAAGAAFAAAARADGAGKTAEPRPAPTDAGPREQAPAMPDEYAEQPAAELIDPKIGQLSEAEALAVLDEVQSRYRVDRNRVYLMGNSAGGVGTLYLAAKHPEPWAAISPQGGAIAAWSYPWWRLREAKIPALFVHGDRDEHANARWSRAMADAAVADGVDAKLFIVPDGSHSRGWTKALPQIFDFFAAHVRTETGTAARH